jgi:hypothetical protein
MRHARLASALPIGSLALAVILPACRGGLVSAEMPAVAVAVFASGSRRCNSVGLDHNSHKY